MPTSHYKQIPDVIEAVLSVKPTSILEVGIGCGKWGALLDEYLTVWDHYFEPWRSRKLRIVGIEVFPLYSDSPAWKCYDCVLIGDARQIVPSLEERFDAALMVDVLEHFDLPDGEALVASLLDRADSLVIAVPGAFGETVEVWGNEHEIHRADWTADHMRSLGYTVEVFRDDDSRVMVVRP